MGVLSIMRPGKTRARRRYDLCVVRSGEDIPERIAYVGEAIVGLGFRDVNQGDLADIGGGRFKGHDLVSLSIQHDATETFEALFGRWSDFLTRSFPTIEEHRLAADCFEILVCVRQFLERLERRGR